MYQRSCNTFIYLYILLFVSISFITGPPNGPVLFCSLVCVICRRLKRCWCEGRPIAGWPTLYGGPVLLRPVSVTPRSIHTVSQKKPLRLSGQSFITNIQVSVILDRDSCTSSVFASNKFNAVENHLQFLWQRQQTCGAVG